MNWTQSVGQFGRSAPARRMGANRRSNGFAVSRSVPGILHTHASAMGAFAAHSGHWVEKVTNLNTHL